MLIPYINSFASNLTLILLVLLLPEYTTSFQMANRHVIAQEIVSYEAVFKVSKLLDQLCEGLQNLGILQAIRTFPEFFFHLLTYTASASSVDVLEAIYTEHDDDLNFSIVKRFVEEASEKSKISSTTSLSLTF